MKIFIGCGAKENIKDVYFEETKNICKMLCNSNHSLIFGAYLNGMMNICYETFKNENKNITGITIEAYKNDEKTMPDVQTKYLETNFDRLKEIFKISDIFIILPGGIGTLSELFSFIEELKTNQTTKKVILYNIDNYYDNLIKFLKESTTKGFIFESDLNKIKIINNLNDLEGEIKNEGN